MSSDDSSRVRKATLPLTSGSGRIEVEAARPRRSTLETFNEEMAVMERPLEGDVEYIDEAKPSRWRPIVFGALVVVVGAGGALFMSRHRGGAVVDARAAEATTAPLAAAVPSPALAAPAPVVAPAPAEAPVPAEAVAPEAAAPEADDVAEDDAAASDSAARRGSPPKGAWGKLRGKVGHGKPARATSGKTSTYRRTTTTTTTRHVVAKRTVTRHR